MEKQLSRQEIYKGKVIHVVRDEVELDNGVKSYREVVQHNGGVCIGLEDNGYYYMVKQFRYPFNREILEFPAGKLEKDELPDDAIKRESVEETGFEVTNLVKLGSIIPTCGYSNEIIHLYTGSVGKQVGQHFDEDESMILQKYTLSQIEEMIKSGEIVDAKTIAIVYHLRGKSE